MLVQNFSSGTLSSSITNSQTTLAVNLINTLPITPGIFTAIVWNNTAYPSPALDPNAEIIWAQYSSLGNYIIVRGMEGTAAVAHSAGATIGLYITAGVLSIPYIKCSNTQSSGTNGGAATSGSWQTMPLNTKDNDTANIANLTSNQITLPAGTYKVHASAPFYRGSGEQMRLYNITNSSVLVTGNTSSSATTDNTETINEINGIFTLTAQSILQLQYQVSISNAAGLGQGLSFGPEVYAVIEFEMINT